MHVVERIWLVVALLAGPLNAIVTRRLARRPLLLDRRRAYRATLRGLAGLGIVTAIVDGFGSRIGLHALATVPPFPDSAAWTAGALAVMVALSFLIAAIRRAAKQPPGRLALLLMPRSGADWGGYVAVCLAAGLFEEYVCRGFCLGLLADLARSPLLALVLVSLSFGSGHLYQGWIAALRATVLGALLAVPVLATGALLPSIVAHAVVDLLSPLWVRDPAAGEAPA